MKERLTTLVYNLVLKVIKEALQKVNLTLVALQQQNTFDLQVSALICKPVGSDMCRILMTNGLDCQDSRQFDFASEAHQIYHEFFDSLNYVIEQACSLKSQHSSTL